MYIRFYCYITVTLKLFYKFVLMKIYTSTTENTLINTCNNF